MALKTDEIKKQYPLPSYNYRVEIGGAAVGFSEVSGLTLKRETTTYKESPTGSGAPGPITMHMPAQSSPPSITLKKGWVKTASVANLYAWLASTQINQIEKKDVVIQLCDEAGNPVVSWTVVNAFPTQLDAPSFSATSNDAAIESMVLMADTIQIKET